MIVIVGIGAVIEVEAEAISPNFTFVKKEKESKYYVVSTAPCKNKKIFTYLLESRSTN